MGRTQVGIVASVTIVLASVMVSEPSVPASAATAAVTPAADAFVVTSSPTTNRGTSSTIRVRNAAKVSYVRFVVPAVPAGEAVTAATLELVATTGSTCTSGVEVLRAATDTWGETTVTWSNQPGTTGPALDVATWTSAGIRRFDVGAAVTTGGPVSFVLRHAAGCTASADAAFRSRETGADAAKLLVETSGVAAAACADGTDNDGDGLIDHPSDPGCADASDTDETDPPDPTDPPAPGDVVVAAAGDIVCSPTSSAFSGLDPTQCQHRLTDDLLSGADAVLPLGDLQYPAGSLDSFNQAYDPSWGQFASATFPVPGNHEYQTLGARGYFDYWASKSRPTGTSGYHSFDLGPSWHVIGLNSSGRGCTQGPPCTEGSPQNDFLEQDLAATTEPCILAYWHAPLFNSGSRHGNAPAVRPFWDDLYAAGADIVLNGHEHSYQRFTKQDPSGNAATNGIREFIVGTGGAGFYPLLDPPDPELEFGNADSFGVLRLTLSEGSYSWRFVSVTGSVLDSGGPVPCN
ncbi:MAG TPA: DNRLRE domain-containing protein [Actinomycetota bacterium]|nr:DNRLRE domain-containing protein [Actinomycetota bacterium]